MKYLFLDSSNKYLMIAVLDDNKVIASHIEYCFKKQSEKLFPAMISLLADNNIDKNEIEGVIVTIGPGSYTGVRIALSVAKVLCTSKHLPLYTINSLRVYDNACDDTLVLMDARSKRAYCAHYHQGAEVLAPCVMSIDDIKAYLVDKQVKVVGDSELVGLEALEVDFVSNIEASFAYKEKVDNIHTLTPCYLKESDAYKS